MTTCVALKSPELTTHSIDGPSSHSFRCSDGIAPISNPEKLAMNFVHVTVA